MGIDKEQADLDLLLAGVMTILKPGLAELVATHVKSGRLGVDASRFGPTPVGLRRDFTSIDRDDRARHK